MNQEITDFVIASTQQEKHSAYFPLLAVYPHATDLKVPHDKDAQATPGGPL